MNGAITQIPWYLWYPGILMWGGMSVSIFGTTLVGWFLTFVPVYLLLAQVVSVTY